MSEQGVPPLFGDSLPGRSSPPNHLKKTSHENGIHEEPRARLASSFSDQIIDVEDLTSSMLEFVVDLTILEEVFSEHREASIMARFGVPVWPDSIPSTSSAGSAPAVASPETSPPLRKQQDVECHECHRNIAATRYAQHLDKCIGMGRTSRVARKKQQQEQEVNPSSNSHSEDDSVFSNNDDVEWSTKRKKRKRGGSRKHGSSSSKRQRVPPSGLGAPKSS